MTIVALRSKRHRRALAVQKLNHAVPALGLLFAGMQSIRDGEHGFAFWLAIAEVVTSGVLIVLTARTLRAARRPHQETHAHPPHHGVDWVDIAAGFMLCVEALERWHLKHHIARPVILSAITTFALGLSHGRMEQGFLKRRVLRTDDEGIYVGGRPFRAFRAKWDDVVSIDIGPRFAKITRRDGRIRKLDLPDIERGDEVRAALLHARRLLTDNRRPGVKGGTTDG